MSFTIEQTWITNSQRVILVQQQMSNFSAISWREQVTYCTLDDNDVRFVTDQHT